MHTHRTPSPALHLQVGIWVTSSPTCGIQLVTAQTQQRFERRVARRVCQICRQVTV